jgi:excisionase family DNA binding protein
MPTADSGRAKATTQNRGLAVGPDETSDVTVSALPPAIFEAVVHALARALVEEYRARWSVPSSAERHVPPKVSPWLTLSEAAARTQCHGATLRREVRAGRLRAVRVGGRKALRLRPEWIDEWLEASVSS